MEIIFEIIQRNNQQEIQDYFRQLKIQSAKQRKDFEDIALQLLSKEQDKCKAYFYFLEISNDVTLKTLLQEIFTKAFLELNDFGNKQLALQKWQLIPLDFIEKYMEGFDIKPADIQDAQVKILTLLQNKKPLQAMKLIMIFKDQLNMSIFIDKFIQLDAVQDFLKFLDQVNTVRQKTSLEICYRVNQKIQSQKEDYPQLIKIQNRQAVDRTYFPKLDEPYERVEERLQGYPYMLCHVIDKLLENNKVNEAYSVAVRQGLNDQFNLNGVLVENPLLKFDGFGITEQICYQEDPSGFIQFSDFNIHEDQIQFIDSVENYCQSKTQFQMLKLLDLILSFVIILMNSLQEVQLQCKFLLKTMFISSIFSTQEKIRITLILKQLFCQQQNQNWTQCME